MRDKFIRFMQGRNGVDDLSRFSMVTAFVLIILAMFFSGSGVGAVLDFLGLAAIVYTYFRIFSRDTQKRYAEDQKYLNKTAGLRGRFDRWKNRMAQRKTYHIYTCPGCGQKIRIPRGNMRTKVEIDCPKCHRKFVKRR